MFELIRFVMVRIIKTYTFVVYSAMVKILFEASNNSKEKESNSFIDGTRKIV